MNRTDLNGIFEKHEDRTVELWYPDGDHMATIEDNLGLGIEAFEVANIFCRLVNHPDPQPDYRAIAERLAEALTTAADYLHSAGITVEYHSDLDTAQKYYEVEKQSRAALADYESMKGSE